MFFLLKKIYMERSNVKPYNQKKANQSWLPHWEVKAETRCGWGAHFLVKAKRNHLYKTTQWCIRFQHTRLHVSLGFFNQNSKQISSVRLLQATPTQIVSTTNLHRVTYIFNRSIHTIISVVFVSPLPPRERQQQVLSKPSRNSVPGGFWGTIGLISQCFQVHSCYTLVESHILPTNVKIGHLHTIETSTTFTR